MQNFLKKFSCFYTNTNVLFLGGKIKISYLENFNEYLNYEAAQNIKKFKIHFCNVM
jgi:hypothetical protein